jgi:hypothetical protein
MKSPGSPVRTTGLSDVLVSEMRVRITSAGPDIASATRVAAYGRRVGVRRKSCLPGAGRACRALGLTHRRDGPIARADP